MAEMKYEERWARVHTIAGASIVRRSNSSSSSSSSSIELAAEGKRSANANHAIMLISIAGARARARHCNFGGSAPLSLRASALGSICGIICGDRVDCASADFLDRFQRGGNDGGYRKE